MKKYITIKNLGWTFIVLTSLMMLFSGTSKIIGTEEMIKNFTFMNLLPYLALFGVTEVIAAGLLVYPKTSLYGVILTSSFMSGAVAIHLALMGGAGVLFPVILGLLAVTGYFLREHSK